MTRFRGPLLALVVMAHATAAQGIRTTPSGMMLDFEDQDLRVVISALAAASGANLTYTSLPTTKVTLRMETPVPRDSLVNVLKALAEANGITVTETAGLIHLEAPRTQQGGRGNANTNALAQLLQQQQQVPLQLYTYRLKHATAADLADVLTSIFSGAPRSVTLTGPGGVQVSVPQVLTPQGLVAGTQQQQGGRGGRGGQATGRAGAAGRGGVAAFEFATSLAQQAGALSANAGDIRVVAEPSTNSLIVRATESDWQLIQQIVQTVDVRPLQVLIEVTIAEVERSNSLQLGIGGNANRRARGGNGPDQSITVPSTAGERDLIAGLTGTGSVVDFDLALNALADRGDVRVLSLPIIIAQNNKEARLNVGSQRPFVQVTQTVPQDPTSRVQTVQYIDVGTTLTITPVINPDGYVNLAVTQTDDAATTEVQFDAPVISKREASTQIFLRDGQTTVIGGLAGRVNNRTDSGLPFLSRLPLIGWLFGSTRRTEVANELFVFLTPHIVDGDADIDRLRESVKEGTVLLKQQNITPIIRSAPADTLSVPPALRTRPDTGRRVPPDTGRRRPPTESSLAFLESRSFGLR